MKYLLSLLFFCSILQINAQQFIGNDEDLRSIFNNIKMFSQHIMNSDYESIGKAYTRDAKIFPSNRKIIEGREEIVKYWTPTNGSKIKFHKITPEEIKIIGNEAYDYGYYNGVTQSKDGKLSSWKGKYVIIWKKQGTKWLIYLDIWNRVPNDKKKK